MTVRRWRDSKDHNQMKEIIRRLLLPVLPSGFVKIRILVDLVRFELTTSSMPWKRAPNCATGPREVTLNITCAALLGTGPTGSPLSPQSK